MEHFAERITDLLAAKKIVPEEDRELYIYGFYQGFLMILNILTILLIGYAMGMLKESIAFLLAYMPLRSYAGGYHAKTALRCYLASVFIMPCVFFIINQHFWNAVIAFSVMSAAILTVIILAPVDSMDRRFDSMEKGVFRKRAILISSVLVVIGALLWLVGQETIAICVIAALMLSAVMLIAGKIKNSICVFY